MSLRGVLRVAGAFVAAASLANAASTQTVTSVATATDAASTLTVTSTSTPSKTGHQTLETPSLSSGFVSNPNPTEGLPRMEVDIVFPHNETYLRPDNGILPLALSVQNFAKIASMDLPSDTVTFNWSVQAINDTGAVPAGPPGNANAYAYLQGSFRLYTGDIGSNETDSDSNVFVGYANVSQWTDVTKFALQITTEWAANNATGVCGFGEFLGGVQVAGYLVFSLSLDSSGGAASVAAAPDCPAFGMFIEPRTNDPSTKTVYPTTTFTSTEASTTVTVTTLVPTTTTCSVNIYAYGERVAGGNPCLVTVDASVRSAMDSAIASMASSDASYTAAHPIPTYTGKNAAPQMTGLPLVPALVAGIAYGIVF